MIYNIEKIRHDFPMLKQTINGKQLVYFDSAATSQKPQAVIDAMSDFYENHYGTVHRAVYSLARTSTDLYQAARKKIQTFLNAKKLEEIIFTRGTTESINLVAYSFGKAFVHPGDNIIISEMEHHSNIVPWQLLCEDRKAHLRIIPINEHGELRLDEFSKLLDKNTRLVSISHIANSTGTINPVKEIIRQAHSMGAAVLIDGAQSVPHMSVDVQDLDADFYVFSGHKTLGPTGIGILYGREELLNQMPPYQGGGDMIDVVTFPFTTYNVLPLKFEAGTPMIAEVIGLGAAIDYLQDIGLDAIHKWENDLLLYAAQEIKKIPGLRIIGTAKEKGSIISFVIDGIHPLDIGTLLDLKSIAVRTGHHCAQPTMKHFGVSATVRVSFALYNTKQEVDIFLNALEEIVRTLK